MRRKLILLAALFLWAASTAYAADLKEYSKSTPSFSLKYPAKWKLTEQAKPLKLRWEIPATDAEGPPAIIVLNVEDLTQEPTEPDMEDYAVDKITAAWDKFDELEKVDKTMIFVRRFQVQQNMFSAKMNGKSVRIKSLIFIADRVGYTLVFVARQGHFTEYVDDFMALAKSLRFGNESRFD